MRFSVPIFRASLLVAFSLLSYSGGTLAAAAKETVVVGSKSFTESYVLGELMAQVIENTTNIKVERRFGLDSTICFDSVQSGEIDVYPEYSGTATLVLMKDPSLPTGDLPRISAALENQFGVTFLPGFGFENSYGLVVRKELAESEGLQTYSDLNKLSSVSVAFTYQFLNREDGYPSLANAYGFSFDRVRGIQHEMAYPALTSKQIDLTDAFTTDSELLSPELVLLDDDRKFFPHYFAAPLVRSVSLKRLPAMKEALTKLSGTLNNSEMQRLNRDVADMGDDYAAAVSRFLKKKKLIQRETKLANPFWSRLVVHVGLTFFSVLLASMVAIPIGIAVRRSKGWSSSVLGVAGVLQTIPSIAMLGFLLPLFGIGVVPAIVALFLYGLLPILRNTHVGLREVPMPLKEVARGQGLTSWQVLWHIELPLSLRVILAGIRTSAVIAVGTATLAAFIGAGGFGEPIVTGLALNNTKLILSGAIPAALLAIIVEMMFLLIERFGLPKGLRAL